MTTKTDEQERKAFEAWYAEQTDQDYDWWGWEEEHDQYGAKHSRLSWSAWQAAIALDRQGRGEPVVCVTLESAWQAIEHVEQHNGPGRAKQAGAMLVHVVTQPADPVVKESLTVAEPDTCPLFAAVEARNSEPVKVPTDAEIIELAKKHIHPGFDQLNAIRPVKTPYENTEGFKRVKAYTAEILSRFGQPAQQECGCCGRSDGCDPDCDAAQPAASVEPAGTVLWRCVDGEHAHPVVDWNGRPPEDGTQIYTAPVAAQPSAPEGWPKWYCVDKNGNADLCRSESEAYDYARLRSDAFPDRAPFQAMPLTPAPPAARAQQGGQP